MIASLYAGISGLSANATAMTVIGDNIANVNTTAFKSNRSISPTFSALLWEGSRPRPVWAAGRVLGGQRPVDPGVA